MDCCKFKEQMTRIIPSFAGFTAFTPTIPKMYWDVKSQEQRIFGLCKMLNKVICYADMLGENVDEIAKTLQDIEDGKIDPIIEAAVAEWFEEHQEEIFADITALQEAVKALQEDVGEIQTELTALQARKLAQSHFSIESRIPLKSDNTVIEDRNLQSGTVFKQYDRIYAAEWFASDNTEIIDHLTIVDIASNVVAGYLAIEATHGHQLTYNPNTQELAFTSGDRIYYVNVSNPNTPYLARSEQLVDIDGYGYPVYFSWDETYTGFWVLKENATHTDMLLLHTDTNWNLDTTLELDISDYGTYTWQSIVVKNGLAYISCSAPECCVLCDLETGERVNVISYPDFISFLNTTEVEWAGIVDGCIYIGQTNAYPNYLVPVIFKWDMKRGTVGRTEKYIGETRNAGMSKAQYVRVDFANADPRDPFATAMNRPIFKFVEDAINWSKHYNVTPRLSFLTDYPNLGIIEGIELFLAPEETVSIGGLVFDMCIVRIVAATRITFTGEGASAIHTATYLYGARFDACQIVIESDLWTVDNTLLPSLTASNGSFNRSFIVCYSVTDWGVATFQTCALVNRPNSHASVINQSGNNWLNG